jgi:hypothetical protein
MAGNLSTTNLLLGIMAAVSVLQGLLVIGVGVACFIVYRQVMTLIEHVEARHVAPSMVRVNAILDDVKGVTAKVREETERVDQAIRTTVDRVDDTASRVRSNVRAKTSWIVGAAIGLRTVIEQLLTSRAAESRTRG